MSAKKNTRQRARNPTKYQLLNFPHYPHISPNSRVVAFSHGTYSNELYPSNVLPPVTDVETTTINGPINGPSFGIGGVATGIHPLYTGLTVGRTCCEKPVPDDPGRPGGDTPVPDDTSNKPIYDDCT